MVASVSQRPPLAATAFLHLLLYFVHVGVRSHHTSVRYHSKPGRAAPPSGRRGSTNALDGARAPPLNRCGAAADGRTQPVPHGRASQVR
ncbi:hypothetical protein E2C01_047187 [Portunus trituberculatus]|uniref:Secreted protein n=1 Tax=Portunus trituberculatus TaxID=210409 RepID=A0A5B7G847_PORTR|nr:hypothetical protein [Portunus trituberculatus]